MPRLPVRAALAVALVAAAAAAAAHADERQLGLNIHQSADVGVAVAAGCKGQIVRVDFDWYAAEPAQGSYDWSALDAVVAAATSKGLTVLATTGYTPTWASGGAANPTNNAVPVAGSYAAFVTAAVHRYAGRVTYWELWNEPNLSKFFSGTAQQYVDSVLVPGAAAVRAACAGCKVVGPALSTSGSAYADWMQTVLTKAPGSLDVVSGHDYAVFDDMGGGGTSPDFFSKLDHHRVVTVGGTVVYEDPLSLRESMVTFGAASLPLWITETGYEAAYGDATATAAQAHFAAEVLGAMVTRPWWTATVFYEAADVAGGSTQWGFSLADPGAAQGYDPKPVCGVMASPPDWDAGAPVLADGGSSDASEGTDAGDGTDASPGDDGESPGPDATASAPRGGDAGAAATAEGPSGSGHGCEAAPGRGPAPATLAWTALVAIAVALRRRDVRARTPVRQASGVRDSLDRVSLTEDALHEHAELVENEARKTVRKAMVASAIMGVSSAALLSLLAHAGIVRDMQVPTLWALCGGVYSAGAALLLARSGRMRGLRLRALVLTLTFFPTLMFVYGAALTPSGAGTYITGPASYLYFFFIVLSGLLFDRRLALVTGAASAAQYLVAVWFARPALAHLLHTDPLLLQDFTSFPIYFFKALMMVFTGLVVGVWSSSTRRLFAEMLQKERARRSLDRLFGEYVSPEAKARILAESAESIGETRSMAILFSDIRDYSTMSEGRSPAEIVAQLNEYLEAMVACVRGRGGVVDKFIGDAVMATFGGLAPLDDPCGAAVGAATDMLAELETLNARWLKAGTPPLRIGVGVHWGEVLQGSIGSADRKEFTVIGDAVNTASRLESATKEHGATIIVSGEVVTRLGSGVVERQLLRPLGSRRLKGKRVEIDLWSVGPCEERKRPESVVPSSL
ncbi:MAG TPA: adenylate/guanylate cyclase domain-containing protein [Polyangiaceae bacterium]